MRVVRLFGDGLVRKNIGSDLKKGLKVCGNHFKYIRSYITKGLDSYDLLMGSHLDRLLPKQLRNQVLRSRQGILF
jgi:hypothetical protein